jgi:phosphoglycolate phosphatase-like HAD superfamily hydrolase
VAAKRRIVFDKDRTLADFENTWLPALLQSAYALADTVGRANMDGAMLGAGGRDPVTGRIRPGHQ